MIAWIVRKKVNDLRVSGDSYVRYKFIFLMDVVFGVAIVAS